MSVPGSKTGLPGNDRYWNGTRPMPLHQFSSCNAGAIHRGHSAESCAASIHRLPVRRTSTSGARRVLRQINEPAASNEESAPVILLPRTTASTCIEPARALTVEMFRAHILTLSKNDDRDGNVGAAEKSAADACGHSGASAPVGRHVSAATGQGRAPVRGEPVAHPVRSEGGGPDRGSEAACALRRWPDRFGVSR